MLHRAGSWLLQSGIQEPSGGVARYYNASEQRNLPVSTEITGYAASAYAYLHSRTGENAYRDAAVRTVKFLTTQAWNDARGIFPFELRADSPAYFFDCGIIIRGLLAVWRLTGDAGMLDIATICGRSMARDFLTESGIHPAIDVATGQPLPYEQRWSRQPGCFLLKSALAWRDLAVLTGEQKFQSYWSQALRLSLPAHENFLTCEPDPQRLMDRLHAYCYFLEALLSEPADAECMKALRSGMATVSTVLRRLAPEFARSDVYAQLLRIRLIAVEGNMAPLDTEKAAEEATAVEQFQWDSAGPRFDGGFCFGSKQGKLLPYANPVSTAFCVQALDLWRQRNEGAPAATVDALI